MKQPDKWRETIDPFTLKFNNFKLLDILGYPHAGNDVFYVRGMHEDRQIYAFIKVERHDNSNILNEVKTLNELAAIDGLQSFSSMNESIADNEFNENFDCGFDDMFDNMNFLPNIIDYSVESPRYIITEELKGDRLSVILGRNEQLESMEYMKIYGKALAFFHMQKIDVAEVKHRKFFSMPEHEYFEKYNLEDYENYLINHYPVYVNESFVHGDFHYANILWHDKKLSAVLDFELAGMGCSEFDMAWAVFLRPSQKFLKTWNEIDVFLKSYSNYRGFSMDAFKYFYVLIASWFYSLGDDEYKKDVDKLIDFIIKGNMYL